MKEELKRLLNNCYAPYSKYRVSCICIMNDGTKINGVNVENASFGATICAERNAISTAVALGYKIGDFKELHIMVDSDKLAPPCFICRQVISEFFKEDALINLYSNNEEKTFKVSELCPYPFTGDNL